MMSSLRPDDSLFCNVWESNRLRLFNLSIFKGDYNDDILEFSIKTSECSRFWLNKG